MTFARTEMLLFLWALPLLWLAYGYGWRKRQRVLRAFAHRRALQELVPPGTRERRRAKAALVLAAALLLVAAMAGPRYGHQWQSSAYRGADLIIALDCSRSMLARDTAPSRLDHAKRKSADLLALLQGDRVGLVAFAGTAFLQCPLTLDYKAVGLFLDELDPDHMPMGGTDLGVAVRKALSAFDRQSTADKAIILITDGEHTGRDDPAEAAREALAAGVKLFCIGVGSPAGVPIPSGDAGFVRDRGGQVVLSRLDETLLTRLARITGGAYVREVPGGMDLKAIYQAGIRGTMADAELESGRKRVWADRFQWPLFLAFVLLVAARALPATGKPLVAVLLLFPALAAGGPAHAGPLQEGYKAYQQGRYDDALEKFIRGRVRDPENPEVLYNIGNAFYRTGNYGAARDHYRQALSKSTPDLKAKLYYNLGNTAYRQGRLQEAAENYQAALELSPDDIQARENLAFVQRRLQAQPESKEGGGAPEKRPARDGRLDHAPDTPEQPAQLSAPFSTARQPHTPGRDAGEMPWEGRPPPEMTGPGPRALPLQAPPPAAIHMLNRLKEAPGRAMITGPPEHPVEKDW